MTQLLAKQHLLPSTVWMAARLRERGDFGRMLFAGKHYSTIPEAASALSEFAELYGSETEAFSHLDDRPLLLVDEGGALHAAIPDGAVGRSVIVEQTTYGLSPNWRSPAVLVCRSGAKLLFESQIIARGMVRKLESLGLGPERRFAVLGMGALGAALMRTLVGRGADVRGFDVSPPPPDLAAYAGDLIEVLAHGDVILGCTGTDALIGTDLSALSGDKIFASCSSGRIEFAGLEFPRSPCSYATLRGRSGKLNWTLLNGGYPLNFDRVREWEKFEEIILTRRLMIEGIVQATSLFGAQAAGYMMSPAKQYELVTAWLEQVPDRSDLIVPPELSEAYLRIHSEGEYAMAPKPYELHSTTPDALTQMRAHATPYDATVQNITIVVDPGVWSPAYDWSSLFYIENIQGMASRSFLEIGSGTGVISVFAGLEGADPILAVDANPAAVENTQRNFRRHGLKNARAILSEGFDAVQGLFDVVVWNAPYHGCRPADDLERGCADEDYLGIRAFFRDVGDHLAPGGRVVFGFSESGDLPLIEGLIDIAGLQVVRKLSDWRDGYNCMLFDLRRARPARGSAEG